MLDDIETDLVKRTIESEVRIKHYSNGIGWFMVHNLARDASGPWRPSALVRAEVLDIHGKTCALVWMPPGSCSFFQGLRVVLDVLPETKATVDLYQGVHRNPCPVGFPAGEYWIKERPPECKNALLLDRPGKSFVAWIRNNGPGPVGVTANGGARHTLMNGSTFWWHDCWKLELDHMATPESRGIFSAMEMRFPHMHKNDPFPRDGDTD